MTLTYLDRKLRNDAIIIAVSMIPMFFIIFIPNIYTSFLLFSPLIGLFITMYRKEKPLSKPIFEKCHHNTRNRFNRICQRCGIKVVWQGDEFKDFD